MDLLKCIASNKQLLALYIDKTPCMETLIFLSTNVLHTCLYVVSHETYCRLYFVPSVRAGPGNSSRAAGLKLELGLVTVHGLQD